MRAGMESDASSVKSEKDRVCGSSTPSKQGAGMRGRLSGKPKVYEMKKEKKRRLVLSDSDEEKPSPRQKIGSGTNRNSNSSTEPKKKGFDPIKGKGETKIDEKTIQDVGREQKKSKVDSFRVKGDAKIDVTRRRLETLKQRDEKTDVSDPYEYREDEEVNSKITVGAGMKMKSQGPSSSKFRVDNKRKIKTKSFDCKDENDDVPSPFVYIDNDEGQRKRVMGGGAEKRRKLADSSCFMGAAEIDRKRTKMESRNGADEKFGIRVSWDLGSKLLVPASRWKEGEAECNGNGHKRISNFPRNSVSEVGRRRTGFDRKRFKLEKDDKAKMLQGKGDALRLLPRNRKVGRFEKGYDQGIAEEGRKDSASGSIPEGKVLPCLSFSVEKNHEKPPSNHEKTPSKVVMGKNHAKKQKILSSDKTRIHVAKKRDGDGMIKTRSGNKDTFGIKAESRDRQECRPAFSGPQTKQKRGRAEEKQVLRERIKSMLLNAGWRIDCRQRKSRDYKDFVYISSTGREYWSIVNAYYALQEQLNCESKDSAFCKKLNGTKCPFPVIPVAELSILTRKTVKKEKKEQKKKLKGASKSAKETVKTKFVNSKCIVNNIDSCIKKDKSSSCSVLEGKLFRGRGKENNLAGPESMGSTRNRFGDIAKKSSCINGKPLLNEEGDSAASALEERPKSVRSLKASFTSDAHLLQGAKHKKRRGCGLLVRSSSNGGNVDADDFVAYTGKRSVLSWLIDSGTVPMNGKVQYMNKRRTRAMLKGLLTNDGIHCSCCSKILTVSKFEIHAGSKLCQPFQNIFVESGNSLLQCQLDAWNKQNESERRGFHFIDLSGDDPNDDTCGICGDGGDLICCDGCPSTFHLCCLNMEMLPQGDWHCPNCTCRFCGTVGSSPQDDSTLLPSCSQCEEKYHQGCISETDIVTVERNGPCASFCGQNCEKLFKCLQKLLGVKNDLEAGFSWTLLRRLDESSDMSWNCLAQRAECNSKLAVALAIMDECFFPIIDQRSGFNLIRNVLYNCGSNFNRLNYSGFYTVVLERDDEIISAASIRFHGTKLAEMPFIGTRHMYRRQGMCRRLLNAIESALYFLNVEKLIIPAVSELMHTWTTVFDFKPLEESHRLEMRSVNMMVFPGTDMLRKPLLKHDFPEQNKAISSVVEAAIEFKSSHDDTPEVVNLDSSDTIQHANELEERVADAESTLLSSHGSPVNTYDTSDISNILVQGNLCSNSKKLDKSPESASDMGFLSYTQTAHCGETDGEYQPLVASNVPAMLASDEATGYKTGVKVEVAAGPNDYNASEGFRNGMADVVTKLIDAGSFQASGEGNLSHSLDCDSQCCDASPAYNFQAPGVITLQCNSELVSRNSDNAPVMATSLPPDKAHHDVLDLPEKSLSTSPAEHDFTFSDCAVQPGTDPKNEVPSTSAAHGEVSKLASGLNFISGEDKRSELLDKSVGSSSSINILSESNAADQDVCDVTKESVTAFPSECNLHEGDSAPDTNGIGLRNALVLPSDRTFGQTSSCCTAEITTESLEAASEPHCQVSCGISNVNCYSKALYKLPELTSVAIQHDLPLPDKSIRTSVEQDLHTDDASIHLPKGEIVDSEPDAFAEKSIHNISAVFTKSLDNPSGSNIQAIDVTEVQYNSESLHSSPRSVANVDLLPSGGSNACDITQKAVSSEQATCAVPTHASPELIVNGNDLEALPSI